LVIESWEPAALFTSGVGPLDKASRTRWLELGYQTRGRVLRATELGGAIDQERLLVVRTRMGMATEGWQWPESPRTLPTRPMANLLRPAALVPKRALCSGSPPEGAAEAVSGLTTLLRVQRVEIQCRTPVGACPEQTMIRCRAEWVQSLKQVTAPAIYWMTSWQKVWEPRRIGFRGDRPGEVWSERRVRTTGKDLPPLF